MILEQGKLGNTIRNARIENNLSQEKLAEMLDITPTHLKHLESEHRKPSIEVLFRLTKILHISLDTLLFPPASQRDSQLKELYVLLNSCEDNELNILEDIIRSMLKNR